MAVIRPAIKADLPYLPQIEGQAATRLLASGYADLYALFMVYPTPAGAFDQYLADERLWVADVAGLPVGFVAVGEVTPYAHIDEIDVLPEYGRRGLGQALMQAAYAWAKKRGHTHVTLTTQANVPWNAPYYVRLGFRVLPPEQWHSAHHALHCHEAAMGFPVADRVVMIRSL